MTSGAGFGLLFGQTQGAAGGGFDVGGKLALPCAVPGGPAEAVLFQRGAGVLVGLFVKEDLEPVRFLNYSMNGNFLYNTCCRPL